MKTRAKIAITLLIAMMMVISMFPLGTQAAVGTGEGPEDGKLTIHKYLMPDVSTATVEGDGTLA
ncbi:MAG TPA: hypothetical protein DEQ02_08620, partial [Ruminococcaceae bacterium]|nr:hypothetical protein [Oscillospiraceae bacterium]